MSIKPIDKSEDYWEPIMRGGLATTLVYTGYVINRYTGERIFMPGLLGEALLLCKVLNERDTLRNELAAAEAERDALKQAAQELHDWYAFKPEDRSKGRVEMSPTSWATGTLAALLWKLHDVLKGGAS